MVLFRGSNNFSQRFRQGAKWINSYKPYMEKILNLPGVQQRLEPYREDFDNLQTEIRNLKRLYDDDDSAQVDVNLGNIYRSGKSIQKRLRTEFN